MFNLLKSLRHVYTLYMYAALTFLMPNVLDSENTEEDQAEDAKSFRPMVCKYCSD